MDKHQIQYMVVQKNQTTYIAIEEQEAPNHIIAAVEVQERMKKTIDPTGLLGTNVIVNLNK